MIIVLEGFFPSPFSLNSSCCLLFCGSFLSACSQNLHDLGKEG